MCLLSRLVLLLNVDTYKFQLWCLQALKPQYTTDEALIKLCIKKLKNFTKLYFKAFKQIIDWQSLALCCKLDWNGSYSVTSAWIFYVVPYVNMRCPDNHWRLFLCSIRTVEILFCIWHLRAKENFSWRYSYVVQLIRIVDTFPRFYFPENLESIFAPLKVS